MDNDLQRERARINSIISKFALNYTSPISLAKQTLHKLTRHKKVYSYDADTVKEQEGNIKSMKFLLDRVMNQFNNEKQPRATEETLAKSSANNSPQHIFTFQTLREALAQNPDLSRLIHHGKNLPELPDKTQKEKKRRHYLSEIKEGKFLRHLPSLNEYSNVANSRSPTFLRVISKKVLMNNERSHKRNSFDAELKNLVENDEFYDKHRKSFEEIIGVKANNKPLGIIKGRKPKSERSYLSLPETKGKVLHVVLPRSIRREANESVYKNYDEASIKGWDKLTPFEISES